MAQPTSIRSTAGFRHLSLYELNANNYPIGLLTLQAMNPYTVSGSVISGSSALVSAGASVSGSVGYYGALHSGARVLTINDPTPRIISHIGDDGVFGVQVLPPTEVMNGELQVDKTNDIVDAIASAVKRVTIGESNLFLQATDKRGFENPLAALAYSASQDADPDSASFGSQLWDFRIIPQAIVFPRESGYGQEDNVRQYSFTPMFATAYPWGVKYTDAVEGCLRSQMARGNSQGKPNMVSYLGDGATVGFPFDSSKPAKSITKVTVWVDGVLKTTGISVSVRGVSFAAAPASASVVVVFYES
jgi:hypothetical protein